MTINKFTTNLSIELKEDSKVWILTSTLVYESDLIGKVSVPIGFQTDLASVPRIPIIYAMWGDRAHREAVIHDYLFRIDSFPIVSFDIANKVLLEAMKARGRPWHIRYPMYWGVCIGAHGYYHKHKVADLID